MTTSFLTSTNLKNYFIGALPAIFYFISHLSMLESNIKIIIYSLILLLVLFILTLKLSHYLLIGSINKTFVLILIYVCMVFLYSRIYPAEYEYGLDKVYYIYGILLLTLFTVIVVFKNKKSLESFVFFLFLSSLFYCFLSIFLGVDESNIRKSSIGLNPNLMAKMSIISAIFVLARIMLYYKRTFIYYIIVFISIFAVFKTGSRGPLLAFILSFVVLYSLRSGPIKSFRLIFILPILGFLLYSLIQTLPETISQRFSLEAISVSNNSDEGDRIQLWQTAFEVISNNIFGIGSGNFLNHSFIAVPHNIVLEIGVEYGLIPMFVFSILLILSLIKACVSIGKDNSLLNNFIFLLFITQIVNSMLGGDLSIQSYLLYICIFYFLFSYNKKYEVTQHSV